MRNLQTLIFLLFISSFCRASPFLIYFCDKGLNKVPCLSSQNKLRHAKQRIAYDQLDLEVNDAYVKVIVSKGFKLLGSSRWLNAICIEANYMDLRQLNGFKFILKIEPLTCHPLLPLQTEEQPPGVYLSTFRQLQMLQIDRLHLGGYNGKGIYITVIDNGFTNVDKLPPYRHLYDENRIKQTKNFVDPSLTVYEMRGDGEHGSRVFSVLAGWMPPNFIGAAYGANYFLAVTEDMTREGVMEEWNWLLASEWADSLGTDIISTSLGYATNFTYGNNHTYEEMDGKTTIISRAANLAASRGILVVNSAGNEGGTAWKHIIAPADADSVLAVGAVDEWENYAAFSSMGPTFDDRIKPDVAAMGGLTITFLPQGFLKTGNGTSFACPLMAGLAACLWQVDTTISNMELFSMIKNSGSRALNPDNYLGWGIPRGDSVYYWLTGKNLPNSVSITNALTVYPNPSNGNMQFSYINYDKEQDVELGVFDSQGREVISTNFKLKNGYQVYPLDLSLLKLRKGLYYLRIKAEGNVQVFENKLSICE